MRSKYFVPADHALSMLLQKFEESLVEIILQRGGVLEIMFAHEGLDTRISLPLCAVVLIPSDVHEVVGEDNGHLCDKSVEEFIGAFSRRIHHRIEDTELPLDVEGARPAGEIGISDEP